jgi:asparagine synthase (glutamine-hydrolysing)
MTDVITHRGPNDDGFYVGPGIGLGMRRLSIIDLETGKQPISNEDGTIWVVLNGEIYNFRQKRRELESRGHSFATSTDTEIIVHLYEEYGRRCVEHLRGMFCFALWDERERQLLLARDRIGIKPLYYTFADERLLFASEVKCLLQDPGVERHLDWAAVSHYFSFLVTPASQSILRGIRKLEPGRILLLPQGREPVIERYWDMRIEPRHDRTEGEIIEELRHILQEAVALHMVSDVPIGAFLSGGLDSSSVAALMARAADRPIKTFSIGFADEEYDELEHARRVAAHIQAEHRDVVLEPDVLAIIDELVWYLDEPFGDSSAIPTFMVSKMAAEEVTVILSGDGGDELFAGYDKYVVESKERRWDLIPRPMKATLGLISRMIPDGFRGRNFTRHFALSGVERYLDACTYFHERQKKRLFSPEAFERMSASDPWTAAIENLTAANGDWLSALQYEDFQSYLPLDILAKVDRMSMAHSIEARPPLLDHEVVEFVATIPSELKLRDGRTKYIFKEAMRGMIPDSIIDRRKQGFAIPLGRWFRGTLSDFVRDLLLSCSARQRGIWNPEYVEHLIREHERGRPHDLRLWTMISFELWCRQFLDGAATPVEPRSSTPVRIGRATASLCASETLES